MRNEITEQYFPDKVTVYDFINEIEEYLKPFLANMEYLGYHSKELYMEEWADMFIRWNEMVK